MDVERARLPLPLPSLLAGKSAVSLAKATSNPSLLLHRNAVHREDLMRKKDDMDRRRYRYKSLDELKYEDSGLRGQQSPFWHSLYVADENFGIRIPGFRFKANGDYKKSITRMREERLKESLKELRKQRSSRGHLSAMESTARNAAGANGRQGAPDQQDVAAAAQEDSREEMGSFVYPHLTPSYIVRKVHCQLGLESRQPSLLALSERAETLGHGVNTENALQLLYKALKNPAMEDVARRSLAKLVDWEGPAHSSGRVGQEPGDRRAGRLLGRRRCDACYRSLLQSSQVDRNQNEVSPTLVLKPRWCLAPSGIFVPPPAKGVSTSGSSSRKRREDSGSPSLKASTPVVTMSSPAVLDIRPNSGNRRASSSPHQSLQEFSSGTRLHRPALVPNTVQAARVSSLDSAVTVASGNQSSFTHQSSRDSPSTLLRPSRRTSKRSSVDDLKMKIVRLYCFFDIHAPVLPPSAQPYRFLPHSDNLYPITRRIPERVVMSWLTFGAETCTLYYV